MLDNIPIDGIVFLCHHYDYVMTISYYFLSFPEKSEKLERKVKGLLLSNMILNMERHVTA